MSTLQPLLCAFSQFMPPLCSASFIILVLPAVPLCNMWFVAQLLPFPELNIDGGA